ncbi:ribonuclease [Corynebacterium tuberculostearicum]|uniref:ribonuclease n=1 Tax=Corynebacterium tuberculostearicum TaxID=38304 RepID=UPI00265D1292|nr:ribonuclease [Corynebacterium tuberculostearicum]
MAEYLKEYKTLPDDFMEHDVEQLESEYKPESFELNAENLKKAGKASCKNDELFEISKGYIVGDTEKFGEALMADGGPEEKFGDVLDELGVPDDAPDKDKCMAATMSPLGVIMTCGDEFSGEELDKAMKPFTEARALAPLFSNLPRPYARQRWHDLPLL